MIAAPLIALLLVVNSRYYFGTEIHEQGDFAANALQINRAKRFAELYGNYSRFGFHHPGPAFFYVYAGAEWLLFDEWKIVPSPHNAHAIAGMVIQVGFFALALAIISNAVRARLFLPLALFGAALHFTWVHPAFVSLWPPHVLLMPFFCFMAAATSVGTGRIEHLPVLAISGAFLVHGHVAQPLFVLSGSATACTLGWWSVRARAPGTYWRAHRPAWLISVVIVGVFAIPLLADLAGGTNGNFGRIVKHLTLDAEAPNEAAKAFLYCVSFLGYVQDQLDLLRDLSRENLSRLLQPWPYYLTWVGMLAFTLYRAAGARSTMPADARRFVRFGLATLGVIAILCFVWARKQSGGMHQYNGFFFFAVTFFLYALFCAALASLLSTRGASFLSVGLVAAAAVVAVRGKQLPALDSQESGMNILKATRIALAADPNPHSDVYLSFRHDDWPEAVSIALALERAGRRAWVGSAWSIVFGEQHAKSMSETFESSDLSTWRLVRRVECPPGIPLRRDLGIALTPPSVTPGASRISGGVGGNLPCFFLTGFEGPQDDRTLTIDQPAVIQLRPQPSEGDVLVSADLEPLDLPPTHLRVHWNGSLVYEGNLGAREIVEMRIPRELWNESALATLAFSFPDARSPYERGDSGDERIFGVAVRSISFARAPVPGSDGAHLVP